MREAHEIWLEGTGEEATIHIGTPKQISDQIKKGEISYTAKRLMELPNSTFEEAEEQVQLLMNDLDLEEDSGEY